MSHDPFDYLDELEASMDLQPAEAGVTLLEPQVPTAGPEPTPDLPAEEKRLVAEPVTPPAGKGTHRRTKVLYFDLETAPDFDRQDLFGLEGLPQPKERLYVEQCLSKELMLGGTVEHIKERLGNIPEGQGWPAEWLKSLIESEQAAPKPRSTVLALLKSQLSDCEQEQEHITAATAAQHKQMAVSPEMNRILAMGWSVGDQPVQSLVVGQADPVSGVKVSEADVLYTFWQLVANCKSVCGYNVIGFDLPTIFVRSMLLGVEATRLFDLAPWKGDVIDLMAIRFARSKAEKLKTLARVMGIKVPAEGVDGSQVSSLTPERLGEYVRSDVAVTRDLHRLYRGFFC